MRGGKLSWALCLAVAATCANCTYILGLEGIPTDGTGGGGASTSTSSSDAGPGNGGSGGSNGECPDPALTRCGTACVNTTNDEEHCGGCDQSCAGGTCSNSRCEPYEFAGTEHDPDSVIVHGGYAYWVNTGPTPDVIRRASTEGGAAESLLTMSSHDGLKEIIICGSSLCAATETEVLHGPLESAGSLSAVEGATQPWLAADSGYLYWTSNTNVRRAAHEMWTPELLATNPDDLQDIAVDAQGVYCTTSSTVVQIPFDGPLDVLSSGGAPIEVVSDGATVCWTDELEETVKCKPVSGDMVSTISAGGPPSSIVLYGGFVYWIDVPGNVVARAGIGGGAREDLATGQIDLTSLAVADNHVYWTKGSEGKIMGLVVW